MGSIRKGHSRTQSEPFHPAPINVSTDASGVDNLVCKGMEKFIDLNILVERKEFNRVLVVGKHCLNLPIVQKDFFF